MDRRGQEEGSQAVSVRRSGRGNAFHQNDLKFNLYGVRGGALEWKFTRHVEGYIKEKCWCCYLAGLCEACSVTWNLVTSTFDLVPRKPKGNLVRVGRSQDANWLLASSPPVNTRTLTSVPGCAVVLLQNGYMLNNYPAYISIRPAQYSQFFWYSEIVLQHTA
jgi:hypothetical protein